jgi:phage terminase large subunit
LWTVDNALVSYYAPTRDDARSIAWEAYKELLRDITIKTNESLLEIETTNKHGTKSLLRLAGWEAVKNRDKGRGVENDLVVLDEAAFFPMFQEKFDKVIEPTLLTSKGRLIITSTPNGFNHFYALAQKAQQDKDWYYSHATSYDNPHNDPAELDRLREQKTEDSFAQEYLADFRKVEGLVYKEFDQTRHYLTKLPDGVIDNSVGIRGCIDFGFTNPTAMYSILRDRDATYYIFDEYQETGKVQDELNALMLSRRLESWYPDPAEPDRIAMMRRSGLRVNEVSKDVTAGINTVQTLLRQNRLFIVNCPQLLFEINYYRWREKTASGMNQNAPEEPIKEHDHGLDAVRYALHMWEATSQAPTDYVFEEEPPLFRDIGL